MLWFGKVLRRRGQVGWQGGLGRAWMRVGLQMWMWLRRLYMVLVAIAKSCSDCLGNLFILIEAGLWIGF